MLPLSFIVLAGVCAFFRVRVLSGLFCLVFCIPLVAVPLFPLIGTYLATILATILILALLSRSTLRSSQPMSGSGELVLFAVSWILLRHLIEAWPEFYNLGEHLRDFAILSEVIRHPLQPKDPWCNALILNYYVYWYRFAAILTSIFGLSIAETYHQMIAFAPAATFAILVRCFRICGRWSFRSSLVSSALILFGSNVSGVVTVATAGHWWKPSRAIEIGITEFPAWSFLLGDLHPHYLSMVLPAFYLLLVLESEGVRGRWLRLLYLVAFGIFCAGLTGAANTWDLVGLGLLVLPIATLELFGVLVKTHLWNSENEAHGIGGRAFLPITSLILLGALAVLSTLHLQPVPLTLKLVTGSIPRVDPLQFLSHWGVPLTLLGFSTAVLRRKLFFEVIPVSIALGSLLILICQSFFYFDDLYGETHERLNTIFKLSFFSWIPLHFSAFLLARTAFLALPNDLRADFGLKSAIFAGVSILFLFFLHTVYAGRPVSLSRYQIPRSEGLSKLELETPGSAKIISAIRDHANPGSVLEWNEPAYSNASSICSLSGKGCYLGWVNHLRIQYSRGDSELTRRQSS
jgi:uncharacterized membrane protein